jgi:hypothetical protein
MELIWRRSSILPDLLKISKISPFLGVPSGSSVQALFDALASSLASGGVAMALTSGYMRSLYVFQ